LPYSKVLSKAVDKAGGGTADEEDNTGRCRVVRYFWDLFAARKLAGKKEDGL
jgi:hypothetical protein